MTEPLEGASPMVAVASFQPAVVFSLLGDLIYFRSSPLATSLSLTPPTKGERWSKHLRVWKYSVDSYDNLLSEPCQVRLTKHGSIFVTTRAAVEPRLIGEVLEEREKKRLEKIEREEKEAEERVATLLNFGNGYANEKRDKEARAETEPVLPPMDEVVEQFDVSDVLSLDNLYDSFTQQPFENIVVFDRSRYIESTDADDPASFATTQLDPLFAIRVESLLSTGSFVDLLARMNPEAQRSELRRFTRPLTLFRKRDADVEERTKGDDSQSIAFSETKPTRLAELASTTDEKEDLPGGDDDDIESILFPVKDRTATRNNPQPTSTTLEQMPPLATSQSFDNSGAGTKCGPKERYLLNPFKTVITEQRRQTSNPLDFPVALAHKEATIVTVEKVSTFMFEAEKDRQKEWQQDKKLVASFIANGRKAAQEMVYLTKQAQEEELERQKMMHRRRWWAEYNAQGRPQQRALSIPLTQASQPHPPPPSVQAESDDLPRRPAPRSISSIWSSY